MGRAGSDGLAEACVATTEDGGGVDGPSPDVDAAPLSDLTERYGAKAQEIPVDLGVATDGAYAIAGSFQLGATDLGGGPLMPKGLGDIFVGAYESSWVHRWSARFGNTLADEAGAVAVDADDSMYVAGRYTGAIDLNGKVLVPAAGANETDLFVAKFDATGQCLWARSIGGAGFETMNGLAVDPSGVYVAGGFATTVDFGQGDVTPVGDADAYIVRRSRADGETLWVKSFGGSGADGIGGLALAGDVLAVSGRTAGVAKPGQGNITGPAAFVATYQADSGSIRWQRRLGTSPGGQVADSTQVSAVAVDTSGAVVACGWFPNLTDLGVGPVASAGGTDMFVVRYEGVGGGHSWSRTFGAKEDDACKSVSRDPLGAVLIGGSFRGSVDFAVQQATAAGQAEKLLTSGGTGAESFSALRVGANKLWLLGTFQGTVDFGGAQLTDTGNGDLLLPPRPALTPRVTPANP
jgi:hypothetical protein